MNISVNVNVHDDRLNALPALIKGLHQWANI